MVRFFYTWHRKPYFGIHGANWSVLVKICDWSPWSHVNEAGLRSVQFGPVVVEMPSRS